ncbi:Aspartic proteinase [Nymphaea thermarum]|nr:Aspartic proteinase [Nymphaea thermarum]
MRRSHLLPIVRCVAAVTLLSCCCCCLAAEGGGEVDGSSLLLQSHLRKSTVIFPMNGSVYPDGLFYVTMWIGKPPKPYFLDVDTGSDLTWLQCDAPCISCSQGAHPLYKPKKTNLVPCRDPQCISLGSLREYECEKPDQQCDYLIEYADRSSSLGVIVKETFYLRSASGTLLRPSLSFGCGYDQRGSLANLQSAADGILGLGSGKPSIVSQLKDHGIATNVIGHCISPQGKVGYLFFGDDLVPSTKSATWIAMHSHPSGKYSPGPANLIFGKQRIKDLMVIFDSGSSYTYFTSRVYEVLLSEISKDLSGKPIKKTREDIALPLCWQGPKAFTSFSEVNNYFKQMVLEFKNSKKAKLTMSPENYLIITAQGNVCLGILNGTEVDLGDLNLIGDISMQSHVIVYDNEKHQIGWAPANCNRLPIFDGATQFSSQCHGADVPTNEFKQCPATYLPETS